MARFFHTTAASFSSEFQQFLASRQQDLSSVSGAVTEIITAIRQRGDAALLEYTQKWDKHPANQISDLTLSTQDCDAARAESAPELLDALTLAAERIRAYHEKQRPEDAFFDDGDGNQLGWQWRPMRAAGLYVPGGRAIYPSSVLMNAIPAKVAGVKRLVMVTPTPEGSIAPSLLAAASIAGIDECYTIGGAQAIAALALGTASIAPVDVIVGPGNAYVAEAKRQLFGQVGIDSVAGPSEICVVADAQNNPHWIAADLLSQAEHGAESQALLITDDTAFAKAVCSEIETILQTLPRAEIARQSWRDYGAVILVENVASCGDLIDRIAPEHLELAIENPRDFARQLHCAGAIFLGRHTPEAFGDYTAGPSHVLPTGGTARFSSGLSVYDFMVRQSLIQASPIGLRRAGEAGITLAQTEGLDAHALSLQCRIPHD